MNLTLSVDPKTVELARKATAAMGLSLNQAIRGYLQQLAGGGSATEDADEMVALSNSSKGKSSGARINRDTLHDRSAS